MIHTGEDFSQLAERIRLAEDFASLGYWRFDYTTKQVYCSDIVFTKILEIPVPEGNVIPFQQLVSYIFPQDVARLEAVAENVALVGKKLEYRMVVGDGIKNVLNKVISIRRDGCGGVVTEGYIQDITDIIFERHELQSLRHAVDHIDEEVYAFTADGHLYYINGLVRERYRLNQSGDFYNIQQINPDYGPEQLRELFSKASSNPGTYRFGTEHRLPDGTRIPVLVHLYKDKDMNGNPFIWAYARDMSASVRQSTRINHLNRLIETIMKDAPIAIYVKNGVDFRHIHWSQASERMTGVSEAQAVGHTDFDIFPDRDEAQRMRDTDIVLIEEGGKVEYLSQWKMPSGEIRTVKTIKTVICEPDADPVIVALSIDVSESKTAEQELIRARLAAEQSNTLKSALVAGFSHDMRTSLNDIMGFTQIIAQEQDPAQRKSYSSIIEKSIGKLLEEIGMVVDVSKLDTGKIEVANEPFSVKQMCADLWDRLRGTMPRGVELAFDREGAEELWVNSDRKRVEQLLSNVVSIAAGRLSSGRVAFAYRHADGKLEFRVRNNGRGVDGGDLKEEFQRFLSHEGEHEDGLKVTLSRMIVEMMGGTLDLSACGEGELQFTFTVACNPERREEMKEALQDSASAAKPKHEGLKNVLVAEDVDSNFQLLQALIGKYYNLRRAVNGRKAVDMFRDSQDQTDLILMDMKMPEMNGLEATAEIRKFNSNISIVALTANAFNDDRVAAMNAGCNDFLTKPISADLLRATIDKYT